MPLMPAFLALGLPVTLSCWARSSGLSQMRHRIRVTTPLQSKIDTEPLQVWEGSAPRKPPQKGPNSQIDASYSV